MSGENGQSVGDQSINDPKSALKWDQVLGKRRKRVLVHIYTLHLSSLIPRLKASLCPLEYSDAHKITAFPSPLLFHLARRWHRHHQRYERSSLRLPSSHPSSSSDSRCPAIQLHSPRYVSIYPPPSTPMIENANLDR